MVDPASGASSNPGVAVLQKGKLVANFELNVPLGTAPKRLNWIYTAMQREVGPYIKGKHVLVIEKLRGRMLKEVLKWSAGVAVAAFPEAILFEMPIPSWHSLRTADYVKSDKEDARLMAELILKVTKEL